MILARRPVVLVNWLVDWLIGCLVYLGLHKGKYALATRCVKRWH